MIETFKCERCNYSAGVKDEYGQQIKREYNGETVCVSCLVTLKLANDDYQ